MVTETPNNGSKNETRPPQDKESKESTKVQEDAGKNGEKASDTTAKSHRSKDTQNEKAKELAKVSQE